MIDDLDRRASLMALKSAIRRADQRAGRLDPAHEQEREQIVARINLALDPRARRARPKPKARVVRSERAGDDNVIKFPPPQRDADV
jgi:hypothetical protein